MLVLGIETSCDESAAAVVEDGRRVRSSVIFSQVPLHQPYGGVVPEIASRSHVEKIGGVIGEAVREAFEPGAGCGPVLPEWWRQIDAVAVTYGPGLASSLFVGSRLAKGLALRWCQPLIGINHIEAHLHSVLSGPSARISEVGALLGLVVFGRTHLLDRLGSPGSTDHRPDARRCGGEAFDRPRRCWGWAIRGAGA
jgi:N6-L-threonylcarbamoyladenine synthase